MNRQIAFGGMTSADWKAALNYADNIINKLKCGDTNILKVVCNNSKNSNIQCANNAECAKIKDQNIPDCLDSGYCGLKDAEPCLTWKTEDDSRTWEFPSRISTTHCSKDSECDSFTKDGNGKCVKKNSDKKGFCGFVNNEKKGHCHINDKRTCDMYSQLPYITMSDGNTNTSGRCQSVACEEDTECSSGECVTTNRCKGVPCVDNTTCNASKNQICVSGTCSNYDCSKDDDCGDGTTNTCVQKKVCKSTDCTSDDQCKEGTTNVCLGIGKCPMIPPDDTIQKGYLEWHRADYCDGKTSTCKGGSSTCTDNKCTCVDTNDCRGSAVCKDKVCTTVPEDIDGLYKDGICVYGNFVLRQFCENPQCISEEYPSTEPPFVYNQRNGTCSIAQGYCKSHGTAYLLNDKEDPKECTLEDGASRFPNPASRGSCSDGQICSPQRRRGYETGGLSMYTGELYCQDETSECKKDNFGDKAMEMMLGNTIYKTLEGDVDWPACKSKDAFKHKSDKKVVDFIIDRVFEEGKKLKDAQPNILIRVISDEEKYKTMYVKKYIDKNISNYIFTKGNEIFSGFKKEEFDTKKYKIINKNGKYYVKLSKEQITDNKTFQRMYMLDKLQGDLIRVVKTVDKFIHKDI